MARNLAHGPAWRLVISLHAAKQLSPTGLRRFLDLLLARTAHNYPDFSYAVILKFLPSVPRQADRLVIYKRLHTAYARRPDLQGRVLLALGDDHARGGNKDLALKSYARAATNAVEVASVVIEAARKAEKILSSQPAPRGHHPLPEALRPMRATEGGRGVPKPHVPLQAGQATGRDADRGGAT